MKSIQDPRKSKTDAELHGERHCFFALLTVKHLVEGLFLFEDKVDLVLANDLDAAGWKGVVFKIEVPELSDCCEVTLDLV